ncbi:TPA: ribonuclease H [Patescibacteria group bacterium]|uniref:Ribonuclease H n=2 Tax=Bacteria division Kazan-3B-28 TaxID=1798534 RepID=A0A0G1ZGU3_UNCK3|nr:MAG: ribonuclease H, putative phosphoglycerate mutase [candidate division Kazan bacterium GW2011_GWA1_50_15]KKW25884.1 MAG: Ribonuclease H [candidate division Kazan bacterium GW2011_GWC1_52_13]KKW27102.1 MAG: Ribonuclease H [candidate division Kazan bacterium GW2011_GWB1_52_7]HCL47386.1 ribonuclease H [Patescibacteria group bacterium]HCR42391.1 ribonuclease H [Patescibacteria group bacterium]
MNPVKLYLNTDGGARGNPGPAATGIVVTDASGKPIKTASRYLGTATNNQAEYLALVDGLKIAVKLKPTELVVRMDSELIVKQLKGEYRVKDAGLKPLFAQAQQLITQLSRVNFHHIRRELNKSADQLVNRTLDRHSS